MQATDAPAQTNTHTQSSTEIQLNSMSRNENRFLLRVRHNAYLLQLSIETPFETKRNNPKQPRELNALNSTHRAIGQWHVRLRVC